MFTLLHGGRALLLNFGNPGAVDASGWSGRMHVHDAAYDGPWQIPVVGAVSAPAAVLVRPDGYVAWAGDGGSGGVKAALSACFGTAAAS